MGNIPVTEAHLLGLFLASILYGFHLTTYTFCTEHLLFSNTRVGKGWAMFIISSLLLVNGSFDLLVHFHQIIKAFVFSERVGGPIAVYEDISNWENIVKSLSVVVQTMIGDAMLIYRCWMVYNRSWRAVFVSVILWLGCVGATIWVICVEATLHTNTLVTSKEIRPSGLMFWGLTNALNIITTALLIWRIWQIDRMNQSYISFSNEYTTESGRLLRKVMVIIIESGFLYTSSAFATFITLLCKSNAIYATTGIEAHLAAIAFNLILIRVSKLRKNEGTFLSRDISFVHSHQSQTDSH